MIKTLLHQRDIIEEILEERVLTNRDFVWKKQIKYRLIKDYVDSKAVEIDCLDSTFPYMNEFISSSERLIITPILSECWSLTILSLNLNMGVYVTGNFNSGKTETVKELSKFFGQYCVTVNCSKEMTTESAFRFLQGENFFS